jgi:Ca2+-transporting ATPase
MQRMAKENALLRRLSAVQTLGSTNVVFTDKTGTLTENRMKVRVIETAAGRFHVKGAVHGSDEGFWDEKGVIDLYEKPALRALIEAALLCNNARLPEKEEEREKLNKDPDYLGDPLEVALLEAGEKVNIRRGDLLAKNPLEREVAFDPEKKLMATYHRTGESYLVAVKGAPAAVFEICSRIRTTDGDKKLTVEGKKQWVRRNEHLARKGLRVLGFAVKEVGSIEEAPYENATFLGLVGILDPPRRDVRPSIEACREAGVRVVMATGDQEHTAVTIGRELGLIAEGESGVVHGKDIADPRLLDDHGRKKIMDAKIIVRASPKQKLDLISVYQHEGSIVAMTGDGVNDAPALKKADIGVAMGRRGEQVAREAADMILTDDSFSTIVVAIRFGRVIFENIRKFVVYLISGNLGEIMIVTAASLFGLPLPLLPLQILYLNAINDAFPALALGMGEGESRVMDRPPRERREPILTRKHWLSIIGYGALIGASVFGAFLLMLKTQGRGQAVPVAFLTLAFARLWHVFNMRDNDARTFRNEITSNRFVWGALALSSALIAVAVLAPGLSNVLGLHVPDITGWLVVGGFSILPLIFGQAAKFMTRWAERG